MIIGPSQGREPFGSSLRIGIRLGWLVLIAWGVSSEVRPRLAGTHLIVWALMLAIAPAWLLWPDPSTPRRRLDLVRLCWLAGAGGVVAAFAPLGLVVVGCAAMGLATTLDLLPAAGLALAGPAAILVTTAISRRSLGIVLGGGAAMLAGTLVGVTRRQSNERSQQLALLQTERDRAELEQVRSQVLAERNHVGREIHDVLAHTLGALAVKLESLDATCSSGSASIEELGEGLREARALAVDGLADARRAVTALREHAGAIDEQLAKLCEQSGASLVISGEPRPLAPEVTLALYRVAQESLTNAGKHAPGAPAAVELDFDRAAVTLAVANGEGTAERGELASTGGGFGLQGISERVRLLGGAVEAGPEAQGWRVRARLPV